MESPVIQISNVSITFSSPNRQPVLAVDDVSLIVPEGRIVGIIGPSGSGKSTLLNLVSGLLQPTVGSVLVKGSPVRKIRTDVGYMFARDGMMPWRTALENVEFGLEVRKISNRHEIAREWLRKVGLQQFHSHYRHELSQGMRQRVAVARTFAINPDILLMDEPFGALDSQTRLILQELFLSVWESTKKTVLFVTHDLAEAIFLSDQVVIFTNRPGKVKEIVSINLPRPRLSAAELTVSPEYQDLFRRLWSYIKTEVEVFA